MTDHHPYFVAISPSGQYWPCWSVYVSPLDMTSEGWRIDSFYVSLPDMLEYCEGLCLDFVVHPAITTSGAS